jgi:phosphoribosylglycinamide formyltransferase-1
MLSLLRSIGSSKSRPGKPRGRVASSEHGCVPTSSIVGERVGLTGASGLGYLASVGSIGVLASGSGTILRALLGADLPVAVVVTDRVCGAAAIAREAGIPLELVERTSFGDDFDRVEYTHRVVDVLTRYRVDLVAMAGFGTILEKPMHDAYPDRVVNTHPALLPAFKGWHAVSDALDAGVKVTGCTVHLARLEVDEGPILAQETVLVLPDDTVESLHERIKEVERRLYPAVLRSLVEPSEVEER